MTDREALYAAVCAAPGDDTPRLVYADWLDETGDPADARRAAYVRAAVAFHRLWEADTTAVAVHQMLGKARHSPGGVADWSALDADLTACVAAARTEQKYQPSETALRQGLPKVRGVAYHSPERGFVAGVRVRDAAAFLANAEAIFRAAPVTAVGFSQLTAADARAFAAAGHLARCRSLTFDGCEPAAIRTLGDHPDAAGVSRLTFTSGRAAPGGCEQLAAGKHWTGVTTLDLHDLDDQDAPDNLVAAALRRPVFRRVRHLGLSANALESAAAVAAAETLGDLRTLDLSDNNIGTEGVVALAESKRLRHLRSLALGANELDPSAAAALVTSPRLASLVALQLHSYSEGGLSVRELARPGRRPTLRALHLDGVRTTPRTAAAMAACPALRGLWALALGLCELTDEAAEALTGGHGFPELTVLELDANRLTAAGAAALANWPAPLQWLDLQYNEIGAAGARALIKSPHRQGLKRLIVNGRGTTQLRKHFGMRVVSS